MVTFDNNQDFGCNTNVLGADEQRSHPSYPIAKSQYDVALRAMTSHFKELYSFDIVNIKLIRLLGGLVSFLRRYMEQSRLHKKAYSKAQWLSFWKPLFMKKYNYPEWQIENYFRVFRLEREKNNVGNAIFRPWLYKLKESDKDTGFEKLGKTLGKYAILGIAIYALAKGIGGSILKRKNAIK